MTKDQLEKKVRLQEEEIHRLENAVDYEQERADKYEELFHELDEKAVIRDFSDFCFRLKSDGLWTDELEEFIEGYLTFRNGGETND